MRRITTPEFMDDPAVDAGQLDLALRFIRRVNRRLGGAQALIQHLEAWSPRWPRNRPVTLLDVATGSADIPVLAVRWARSRSLDLRVVGLDVHETTLALAGRHVASNPSEADAILLVRADALSLEDRFERASFDYVHAGMFLHHLNPTEVTTVLRAMARIARAGIVWNDLLRSPIALAGIRVLTAGQSPVIRHDATVSVRKGFTRTEVASLAREAELPWCTYRSSVFTQRFTLAGERPGVWD